MLITNTSLFVSGRNIEAGFHTAIAATEGQSLSGRADVMNGTLSTVDHRFLRNLGIHTQICTQV